MWVCVVRTAQPLCELLLENKDINDGSCCEGVLAETLLPSAAVLCRAGKTPHRAADLFLFSAECGPVQLAAVNRTGVGCSLPLEPWNPSPRRPPCAPVTLLALALHLAAPPPYYIHPV